MQIENAPAKLTLTLRMLDKREDGFNNLRALTVFLPDIADSLETSDDGESRLVVGNVDGTPSTIPTDDTNLVTRAWRAFLDHGAVSKSKKSVPDMFFCLYKSIPHAAGLGGGSADAAAALRVINRNAGDILSTNELEVLAQQLGSDVSACLHSQALWMSGRGEIVELLDETRGEVVQQLSALVVTPHIECSTPEVYRRYEEMGRPHDSGIESPPQLISLTPTLHNDLALAAYDLFPQLLSVKSELENTIDHDVALAGSGSTFFAIDTPERIDHMYSALKNNEYFDDMRLTEMSSLL